VLPFEVTLDPHPLLDVAVFETTFLRPVGEIGRLDPIMDLLSTSAVAPLASDDAVRAAVRDLLRHGGYKPTGRGKPASEYLVRAVGEGALSSINVAVDTCNVVSLHSGLPISVIDADHAKPPFGIGIAEKGVSYVFNASGQTIDVAGLLCLRDADGPCANAVKDSQRTKTSPQTTRTISVIWGTKSLPDRTDATFAWYAKLLESTGAVVVRVC
jgi:DNA/RNA-binding domain of Phe-tRNA-synthetase-like protein